MDSIGGFSEKTQKRFDQEAARAVRKYNQRIAEVDRVNSGFGIVQRHPGEILQARAQVEKEAALEYFEDLLFILLDECCRLPNDELRHRMNEGLAAVRKFTLDHLWPESSHNPIPREQKEQEFDQVLIARIEGLKQWRKFEGRLVPKIVVAADVVVLAEQASNPLWYFTCWQLESLSVIGRGRIKAGLLEIHGAFLDSKREALKCWRGSYDLIAEEFDRARLLSDDVVNNRIPEIVADVVAGGGWSQEPLGRVQPTAIFSCHFGSQFYPRWRRDAFLEALRGRIAHWSGRVATNDHATPKDGTPPQQPSPDLIANRRAILAAFIEMKGFDSVGSLSRHLGISETALQGMVRGDKSRYSESKLNTTLNKMGCSRAEWGGAPKPAAPA
jgi:hypothetical protein